MHVCIGYFLGYFWEFRSKTLPAYWVTEVSKPLAILAAASCYRDCNELCKGPSEVVPIMTNTPFYDYGLHFRRVCFPSCNYRLKGARMPLCFGSTFRKTCNLTIWISGVPHKAFQEHKPKVNIFRCLGLWPGYYIIRCCSPSPTKRRIIVPTEKEDNSTWACAGPKSSHHLWQRWWGRDCRSPAFVCWTWSPVWTAKNDESAHASMKEVVNKDFFFLYPLLHNLYSCDVLFLSKHSSVHCGGVGDGKKKDWNGRNVSVNLSSRDRFHLMGSPVNEVSTLRTRINSALTVNKSDKERVHCGVFSSFFCLDFH